MILVDWWLLVLTVSDISLCSQDEADKKALQSVVENNAEGQALYRDLTHDFAHHADVFKKSPGKLWCALGLFSELSFGANTQWWSFSFSDIASGSSTFDGVESIVNYHWMDWCSGLQLAVSDKTFLFVDVHYVHHCFEDWVKTPPTIWSSCPRFKSARPPIEQLLNMIPVLKPRSPLAARGLGSLLSLWGLDTSIGQLSASTSAQTLIEPQDNRSAVSRRHLETNNWKLHFFSQKRLVL